MIPAGSAARFVATMSVLAVAGSACATASGALGKSAGPDYLVETLDNGLTVYMVEDHSAPLVAYQVWFDVGSVNEHEASGDDAHGITGLSHFFEHMMFRGTAKHPAFFEEIYALGAQLNAFTWFDETVYWENLPSQHLETIIRMEADRLEHTTIDFLNLEPEREVVKSERRLRTDNRPTSLGQELLRARTFTQFPYHWGTIGWMRDLNAITVQEAQSYHAVYYAPNHASVLVVGDFDPAQTMGWIRDAYGHLPPKETPPMDATPEPRQTESRRDRLVKPVQAPVILLGYRAPAVRDADYMALEVLDYILTGGRSSRLQRKMVLTDPPKAARVSASLLPLRHPYIYMWTIKPRPGISTEAIEALLDAEVADIVTRGVSSDELARAVAGLRSQLVRQNLSNKDKAQLMGFALRATDDPWTFIDRLDQYGTVTAEDVQRVAAEVMRPDGRTIVPVVSPARTTDLLGLMVVVAGSLPAGVADAAQRGLELRLNHQDLTAAEAEDQQEERAIALLALRAEDAKAQADEKTRQQIDTYLTENEKGTTVRRQALDARRQSSRDTRRALEAEVRQFKTSIRRLRRARWNPSRTPVAWFLSLAEAANPTAGDDPANVIHGRRTSPRDIALQAAYDVLMAWVIDDRGLAATAQELRDWVLTVTAGVTDPDPGVTALLAAARALAWDTQITGRSLSDIGSDDTRGTP